MSKAQELIQRIFQLLTFPDAHVNVDETPEEISVVVEVPEDSSGVLIGYRGEKINALQLLLTLTLNNQAISHRHVRLDINGYRQRRHDSLKEMADSAAHNAIESGREILLPPLPAYERRIIHMHLGDNPRVETYSEGDADQRRIVIRPVDDSKA